MILELVCLGLVALAVAASCLVALVAAKGMRELNASYTKEVGRLLAQTDESRKVANVQVEAANARLMAHFDPNGHIVQRTNSGVIQGAQSKVEPHFANEAPPPPAAEPSFQPNGSMRDFVRFQEPELKARDVHTQDGYEDDQEERP